MTARAARGMCGGYKKSGVRAEGSCKDAEETQLWWVSQRVARKGSRGVREKRAPQIHRGHVPPCFRAGGAWRVPTASPCFPVGQLRSVRAEAGAAVDLLASLGSEVLRHDGQIMGQIMTNDMSKT